MHLIIRHPTEEAIIKRQIFISHATPEDNEVVRWLAARLDLAGYRVWYDLDRLKGGDVFWSKIEQAIRNDAFRMVAIVSDVALAKSGVQDEWAVGLQIEKQTAGFVIPVAVNGFDFSRLPINFVRKNALSFAGGWHKGLAALLDTLSASNAPREQIDAASVKHWLPDTREGAIAKTQVSEVLESSWLRITSLPPALETAKLLGGEKNVEVTAENSKLPWFEHEGRIVGFAKSSDLVAAFAKHTKIQTASAVDLDMFLAGESKFDGERVRSGEARKRVTHLLRQAWELAMDARGLPTYLQANGRKVHYIAPSVSGGLKAKVAFVDYDGATRRHGLNGHSQKRQMYWHFGVSANPSLDDPRRIELKPAVVFTDLNGNPLDPERQHRLRMSFCRNWWNDRWRGFFRAFLTLIAGPDAEIHLPVGSGRYVVLDAVPVLFQSASGLSDGLPVGDDGNTEELDDESDEGLDEDENDEVSE